MGSTEKIAAAAFFISLSALVTNIALTWLKWPRIVVEVAVRHNGEVPAAASSHAPMRSTGEVFLLTVINNGSEPVTVASVGLTQRGRGAHRLDYLHTWRGPAPDRLPTAHGADDTLIMPLRVDGHGCHVFEYSPSALSEIPPGVHYHGFAKRYKAFRWLPNHPVVSETRSKQTVIRSL
jgi:hypothetical protein